MCLPGVRRPPPAAEGPLASVCIREAGGDPGAPPLSVWVRVSLPVQAEQSREEQKQDLSAEKLLRQASKDVCRLREQSRKVPRQVQSFR